MCSVFNLAHDLQARNEAINVAISLLCGVVRTVAQVSILLNIPVMYPGNI